MEIKFNEKDIEEILGDYLQRNWPTPQNHKWKVTVDRYSHDRAIAELVDINKVNKGEGE